MALATTPVRAMTIVPMPDADQHILAATWAFTRAQFLLAPVGTPELPPKPDLAGAKAALLEAVAQLEDARQIVPGTPIAFKIDEAIAQAHEGIKYIDAPGITPAAPQALRHANAGAELARAALTQITNPLETNARF